VEKMVVLKPVTWNNNGYQWPSGEVFSSGFVEEHGYGHEEWNGRDDWLWDGWKVFDTQGKGKMWEYAASGDLGMIMTVAKDDKFFAVGACANIFVNTDEDKKQIAKHLRLIQYVDRLWEIKAIRDRKANKAVFRTHWQKNHTGVNWRCPDSHYIWFRKPIEFDPHKITGKKAVAKMHGSYQQLEPQQAKDILGEVIFGDHPIMQWLTSGKFRGVKAKKGKSNDKKNGGLSSASTATDEFSRYLKENEVLITPKHHKLQSDFAKFLKTSDLVKTPCKDNVIENVDRIDLQFVQGNERKCLVEVKPTKPETVRFAIRCAMGQLLDYEQSDGGSCSLLIVLDDKPSEHDKKLALTNSFAIAWRDKGSFILNHPN